MPGVPEGENTQYEYLRISRKVTQLLEGGLIARMIQKENEQVARLASGTKRRKGLPLSCILFYHRSIIRQKKRQRSSLLFGGRNEIRTSLFWCEPDDHQFSKASIPPCVRSSIKSISSNHPGAKSLVQYDIESCPIVHLGDGLDQQRQPLPSLLLCFI